MLDNTSLLSDDPNDQLECATDMLRSAREVLAQLCLSGAADVVRCAEPDIRREWTNLGFVLSFLKETNAGAA